ncbi:MAG: metallophosphatase [Saprospiraceae bacterium]|nr:MAG: metallophosphatase [Saprospiraceae bacterium]
MINKINSKGFHLGSLFFIGLFSFCFFSSFACRDSAAGNNEGPTQEAVLVSAVETPDTVPQPVVDSMRTLRIIGVGDMMLGTNYPSASYLPPKGGADMLKDVESILSQADLTFGNLEGTILDEGGTAKRCNNPAVCYVFRSPESYVKHFVNAGFDILSIANNHSGDFGPVGRKKTKELLKKAGIYYAGLAGTDESVIFEKDGITYGFCAFAPNSGTVDIRNISRAKQIVSQLEKEADIVIVSFHGGAEGASNQNVTRKTETYYGENRGNVYAFAHAVVDAGADIVFGHGPHVTRAVELYKDRFIAYSLGNFCTYGRFSLSGPAGYAPLITLTVDETGSFMEGLITPVYQQKAHGPKIDGQKRAINKLRELTKQDFPETPLRIMEDGKIERK